MSHLIVPYYLGRPYCYLPQWIMTLLDPDLNASDKVVYIKGILYDFFIFTLKEIIVLKKYCIYNKPIPEISHIKTLQNLCKMR